MCQWIPNNFLQPRQISQRHRAQQLSQWILNRLLQPRKLRNTRARMTPRTLTSHQKTAPTRTAHSQNRQKKVSQKSGSLTLSNSSCFQNYQLRSARLPGGLLSNLGLSKSPTPLITDNILTSGSQPLCASTETPAMQSASSTLLLRQHPPPAKNCVQLLDGHAIL